MKIIEILKFMFQKEHTPDVTIKGKDMMQINNKLNKILQSLKHNNITISKNK